MAISKDWWQKWYEAGYSWEGLKNHEWIGHEIDGRPATLQDYWRDQVVGEKGPQKLLTAPNGKQYTRVHFPLVEDDGITPTEKANWDEECWEGIQSTIHQKLKDSNFKEHEIYDGMLVPEIAQMQGIVVRDFEIVEKIILIEEYEPKRIESFRSDWTQAYFDGSTNFQDVMFLGSAVFNKAYFVGKTSFWNSKFDKSANFKNAIFLGKAIFDESTFLDVSDFTGSRFEGAANFGSAGFEGRSNFEDVTFLNYVNFRKVSFDSSVSFNGSSFNVGAIFEDGTFTGRTDFGASTKFNCDVNFTGANFNSIAFFQDAYFEKVAHFREVMFKGETSFNNVAFCADTNFGLAEFHKTVDFSCARFKEKARFSNTIFEGFTDFSGVEFEGRPSFKEAIFKGRAHFKNLVWEKEANWRRSFHSASFEKAPNFSGEEAIHYISAFSCVILEKGILLDRHSEREINDAHDKALNSLGDPENIEDKDDSLRALQGGALKLRKSIEEEGDSARALPFHCLELLARQKRTDTPLGIRGALWLYNGISRFGTEIWRPLLFLICTVPILAMAFYFLGTVDPVFIGGGRSTEFYNSIGFSLSNIFPFLGMRELRDSFFFYTEHIKNCEDSIALRLNVIIIAVAHSILSGLMLFLSGLAMKRRFKVG